jgi:hypothetical protein
MVRSFTFVLLATLTLLSAPDVHAGRKPRGDGQSCKKDGQCLSGFCCNGRCSSEAACCNAFAGEVACDVDLCCNTLVGEACCNDEPYGFRCADTETESRNCGACGNYCENGQICRDGACGCPDGQTLCNTYCVDTQSDPDNCGTCGNVCADGQICTDGQCVMSLCQWGQVLCGGECLNSPQPPGGKCCEYDGTHHICAATDQCAGPGCCGAEKEPCVAGNMAQCCDAGLACVMTESGAPACCTLGASEPSVCCGYGNCLPQQCCRQ